MCKLFDVSTASGDWESVLRFKDGEGIVKIGRINGGRFLVGMTANFVLDMFRRITQ